MDELISNNFDNYAQNFELIKQGYGYDEIVQLIDGIKQEDRQYRDPVPNYNPYLGGLLEDHDLFGSAIFNPSPAEHKK